MEVWSELFFIDIEQEISTQLNIAPDRAEGINRVLILLNNKIEYLYNWLNNNRFEEIEKEIHLFKVIKPRLVCNFIYYKKLSEIEANSHFSKSNKIKYLKKLQKEADDHGEKYKSFYRYYYSKFTHKDKKYFLRNKRKSTRYHDSQLINYDFRVSTSHDHLVATILANDKLIIYIENLLENLNNSIKTIETPTKYQWTGKKIELVELIYALKELNIINNGAADIKEIAKLFETMFNVELEENIYRWYLDIKKRKISRTKFLNQLAENLNKKMDNEDE